MAPRLFIKFLSKAIYCSNLKPSTCATCYLFELCQIVVTLLKDAFHIPMIKITYTPHILPTSTLEVEHPFHKIKTPCYSWLFSPSSKDMGC